MLPFKRCSLIITNNIVNKILKLQQNIVKVRFLKIKRKCNKNCTYLPRQRLFHDGQKQKTLCT